MSLSARRAWIEILTDDVSTGGQIKVALRKESVDRNSAYLGDMPLDELSLSARRAWIEMPKIGLMLALSLVALRKESVDRNC